MESPASWHIQAQVWLWQGDSPWHFLTIPTDIAEDIRERVVISRGFGSVRVEVTGGSPEYSWHTSLFPDTKSGGYLLPLKKQARDALECEAGETVSVTVSLRD